MKVLLFTPTYEVNGEEQLRPECRASIEALRVPEGVTLEWVIGRENPWPYPTHRNVLAQYQRAREMALAGGFDALWTVEHDMVVPADAAEKLAATDADVVYGVYLLRHGSYVLNAWQYIGDRNLGESLSLYPAEVAKARARGWARVCGCGWGCTWIARRVLERVTFHDGGGDNPAGDLAFAHDCLREGLVSVARFDVACDHLEGEFRLRPFGGAVNENVTVTALQDVVAPGGARLTRGRAYELPREVASELARAGYVAETTSDERRVTSEEGLETAALEDAPEKAVRKVAKRKRGGL